MRVILTFMAVLGLFVLMVITFIRLASFPLYLLTKKQIRSYINFEDWIISTGYSMRLPSYKEFKDLSYKGLFQKEKNWQEIQKFMFSGRYTTKELLEGSSYSKGTTNIGFFGFLKQSKNKFLVVNQYERRGKAVIKRTVVSVSIPDTKLHMIINSKVNNDSASGGNITNYTNAERYELEGDFGKYFNVYMPDNTQSETLSILTPDTMVYILSNMYKFDIEVVGDKLFLYSYRHLKTSEFERLLANVDYIVGKARIKTDDVKNSSFRTMQLSRRVDSSVKETRSLRYFDRNKYYVILIIATMPVMIVGASTDTSLLIWFGFGGYVLLILFPMYQYAKDRLRQRKLSKILDGYK